MKLCGCLYCLCVLRQVVSYLFFIFILYLGASMQARICMAVNI